MQSRARRRRAANAAGRVAVIAAVMLLARASQSGAQASTPTDGEGTVSVSYQNYYLTGHYDVEGRRTPNGATRSRALSVEFDYGLTDSLALTAVLPFISSKYTGPRPFYLVAGRPTYPGPLDDGTYHGALQDLRLELRYRTRAGPLTLTPLIGVVLPTHDYETIGEAVPGRNRREFQAGANAALPLDRALPHVYVQVRYVLAAAEKVRGYSAVRSMIEVEAGRPVASRLALRGMAVWQVRHKAPGPAEFFDDWRIHDRFMVSNYTNLGMGATISLTSSTSLYVVGMATVRGNYGAHIARLFSTGVSWNFGRRFEGFGEPAAPPALRTR